MNYKIYTGSGNTAMAAVKQWNPNITAALLLSPFGTIPHRNSVAPDAVQQALNLTGKVIQAQFEYIVSSEQNTDFRFVATMLLDAMRQCNDRLREINKALGMGIYIGGNILYVVDHTYLILTFGGGCFFANQNTRCIPNNEAEHSLIRDALGSIPHWSAEFRKGQLEENGNIILLTATPGHYEEFCRELEEDPVNVLTMYAHRTFSTDDIPVAAIEFRI